MRGTLSTVYSCSLSLRSKNAIGIVNETHDAVKVLSNTWKSSSVVWNRKLIEYYRKDLPSVLTDGIHVAFITPVCTQCTPAVMIWAMIGVAGIVSDGWQNIAVC